LALLVAFDDCVRKVGLGGVQVCPGKRRERSEGHDVLTS
jgi:hypothetical protein